MRSGIGRSGVTAALVSALLFGATTPLAKMLLASSHPVLVAGLLYCGSGLGLAGWLCITERGRISSGLARSDWPWLAGAIAAGGVAAPALFMYGLVHSSSAAASLLLNLEVVLTAILAWVVFREATSRRVVLGFVAISIGCLILSSPGASPDLAEHRSVIAIAAACLLWALDNNLTRKVAGGDARIIAAMKGLAAGATNTTLAFALGATLPPFGQSMMILGLGFLGYGVSLVLFVYALRELGAARTGAYFATAPFVGGAIAIWLFGQHAEPSFWIAAACMAIGVWLHLTERHAHEHEHEPITHSHVHIHDEHHQHEHEPGWDGTEPHAHEHVHPRLRHNHPHYPDIHHQHTH